MQSGRLVEFPSFGHELKHNVLKTLVDIRFYQIYAILRTGHFQVHPVRVHRLLVRFTNSCRIRFDFIPGLHINEGIGPILYIQIELALPVIDMKKDDLVFVEPQLLEGVQEFGTTLAVVHHITEDHNQGAAVDRWSNNMQCIGSGGTLLKLFFFVQYPVELLHEVSHVFGITLRPFIKENGITEKTQTDCIPLPTKQFYQRCRRMYGKICLVHFTGPQTGLIRVVHGTAYVQNDLAAQVSLFIKSLDVQFVRSRVELPINMSGALAGVIGPMLSKFNGEPVERALVHTYKKAFHHLFGFEL